MAGESLRREAAGVRGRVRVQHLDGAPEGSGAQRRAGLREGPEKPGQENTTLIAAITLEGGMGEAMAIEGATDAEVFEAYDVEGFLAPTLEAGQVVVLDGLWGRIGRGGSGNSSRGVAPISCSCLPTRRTSTP